MGRLQFPTVALGLNTKKRPTKIPLGACQSGSKNFILDRDVLATAPGYKTIVTQRPDSYSYKLSGQNWRGETTATGSLVGLNAGTRTIEVVFRIDRMQGVQVLLYRGQGEDAGVRYAAHGGSFTQLGWMLEVAEGKVLWTLTAGGATLYQIQAGTTAVQPGVWYHTALKKVGTTYTTYLAVVGSAPSVFTSGVAGPNAINDTTSMNFYVGAMPLNTAATPTSAASTDTELMQFQTHGVVQEVRIWSTARTDQEIEDNNDVEVSTSATGLIAYYRLTGDATDTYFKSPNTGTAGSGSGEAPVLYLEPRRGTWLDSGHILGNPLTGYTYSLDFDGMDDAIEVKDSYLYRKPTSTSDNELSLDERFFFHARLRVSRLTDRQCIWHWTHVPDDEFGSIIARKATAATASGTTGTANEEFTAYLEIKDVGAGVYQFAGVVGYDATGTGYRQTTVVSNIGGGIVVGTEYNVTFCMNFSADASGGASVLFVNSGSTSAAYTANYQVPRGSPDFPDGSFRKYAMSIGRGIYRVRSLGNEPYDPDSVDIEYDYTKSFNGVIAQVAIGAYDAITSSSGTSVSANIAQQIHDILQNATTMSRDLVGSVTARFFSAWSMNVGAGATIEDFGLVGNPLELKFDSNHRWGKSGITTSAKEKILGAFTHTYRTPTGDVRKSIVVAGGSVYDANLTTGALTWIDDGIRNDNKNRFSAMKFQDSLVLCCGGVSGNYTLWKDQVFPLSIEAPSGTLAIGLQDQISDDAVLKRGEYMYGFAFYSAFQDKWSPIGITATVNIRCDKANVAMGTIAEMNQTYAKLPTVISGANGKEPFGVTASAGKKYVNVRSYLSTEATPNDKIVVVGYNNSDVHPFMNDSSDATAVEWANLFEAYAPRAWTEVLPEGRISVNSRFIGSTARLRLNDGTTSVVNNDWNSGGGGTVTASGTGISSHGIALPYSFDPQVTHLGIFRTVAGGSLLQLVAQVPNGTQSFVDTIPDSELRAPIADLTQQEIPAARYVVDFGGRAMFFGDDLAPYRLYISDIAKPWSTITGNIVDLLDGTTLEITGVGRSENMLTVFKNDTLFVFTPTGNDDFPFRVEVRQRDVGGVAPFGIANVDSLFFYPNERGIYSFDTNASVYRSEAVEDEWLGVAAANYSIISAVHDRPHMTVMFAAPSGDSVNSSGQVINDMVFVYDYSKPRGDDGIFYGWSIWDGMYVDQFFTLQDANDVNRIYFTTPEGHLCQFDVGTNFGVDTLTSRTPATGAGTFNTTTVTVAQATLANLPEGYLGLPITVVDATDATGATRATRMCKADTNIGGGFTELTLDHAITNFTPAQADTVLVGSIEFVWKSADFSAVGTDKVTEVKKIHVQATPQSPSATPEVKMLNGYGLQDETGPGVEVSTNDAFTNQAYDALLSFTYGRGRRHSVRFYSRGPDKPLEIISLGVELTDDDSRGKFGE